jgi:hypothetical protein
MTTVRLVGSDTIKINQRLLSDFPHGEIAKLSYSTDLVTVKTGKNGNVIYAKNETGNQATLELHVLRGSGDDKFLNTQMSSYNTDPTHYVLMAAELVKVLGDGAGNVISDNYILTGGVCTKNVEAISNVEGDVEQAVALYTMQFAFAPRTIA